MIIAQIQYGVYMFFQVVSVAIVIHLILSWITRPGTPILVFFERMLSPIYSVVRPIAQQLFTRGFRIDLTPVLAFLIISMIQWVINTMLSWFWF